MHHCEDQGSQEEVGQDQGVGQDHLLRLRLQPGEAGGVKIEAATKRSRREPALKLGKGPELELEGQDQRKNLESVTSASPVEEAATE